MKRRKLALFSLLVGAAYHFYQKRDVLNQKLRRTTATLTNSYDKLEQVKTDATAFQNSLSTLEQLNNSMTYKLRLFQEESQPHLDAIQQIINKYKQDKA